MWTEYIVQDDNGDLWIVYSVNPGYAAARVFDVTGQRAAKEAVRKLTTEDLHTYEKAAAAARRYKNLPIFAGTA